MRQFGIYLLCIRAAVVISGTLTRKNRKISTYAQRLVRRHHPDSMSSRC